MDEETIFREIYDANQSPAFEGIGGDLTDELTIIRNCHEAMAEYFSGYEEELAGLFSDTHDLGKYGVCRMNGGHMPRGFFCPSPVLELCVGNVYRGSLRKIADVKDKQMYFGYRLDDSGRIRVVTTHYGQKETNHEYLFYFGDRVLGVNYGAKTREVESISEERYRDGKIVEYLRSHNYSSSGGPTWLVVERYFYSEDNLKTCIFWELRKSPPITESLRDYFPGFQTDIRAGGHRHDFEVKDGYYSAKTFGYFKKSLGDYAMSDTPMPIKQRIKA